MQTEPAEAKLLPVFLCFFKMTHSIAIHTPRLIDSGAVLFALCQTVQGVLNVRASRRHTAHTQRRTHGIVTDTDISQIAPLWGCMRLLALLLCPQFYRRN